MKTLCIALMMSLVGALSAQATDKSCKDLEQDIAALERGIASMTSAYEQANALYLEMCFSHGGHGSPQCTQMMLGLNELRKDIAMDEQRLAELRKTHAGQCTMSPEECETLSASIERLGQDIEAQERAIDSLHQFFAELCLSHGQLMTPQCQAMSRNLSEMMVASQRLQEKRAGLTATFEEQCR